MKEMVISVFTKGLRKVKNRAKRRVKKQAKWQAKMYVKTSIIAVVGANFSENVQDVFNVILRLF